MSTMYMPSGTLLEREGSTPLLAVAVFAGDGSLASASVMDPAVVDWRYGELGCDPAETRGGAA